jgi:pyrroline-5-carboxylate reductase
MVAPIIGFLGVGTISTAVVHALCSPHGGDHRIVLSPRSEARSRELAEGYSQVARLGSNQEVIDSADIIVLGMRPQQLDEALDGLSFRRDQVIASFIAGSPPSQIQPLVTPAKRVAQLIPLPAIELARGPLLICPAVPEVVSAFGGLGDVIVVEDEAEIRVFSVASAIMSTYYEMQNTVIDWMRSRGIAEEVAAEYILSELEGLAAVGRGTPGAQRGDLPAEHQTKGGLNERVREHLTQAGVFTRLRDALDEVYDNANLRKAQGN